MTYTFSDEEILLIPLFLPAIAMTCYEITKGVFSLTPSSMSLLDTLFPLQGWEMAYFHRKFRKYPLHDPEISYNSYGLNVCALSKFMC